MNTLLVIILAALGLIGIIVISRLLKFPPTFYENQEKIRKIREHLDREQ